MNQKQRLVLLPGLLCDAALWEPQLSDLADMAGLSMGGYIAQEINRTMRSWLCGGAK